MEASPSVLAFLAVRRRGTVKPIALHQPPPDSHRLRIDQRECPYCTTEPDQQIVRLRRHALSALDLYSTATREARTKEVSGLEATNGCSFSAPSQSGAGTIPGRRTK